MLSVAAPNKAMGIGQIMMLIFDNNFCAAIVEVSSLNLLFKSVKAEERTQDLFCIFIYLSHFTAQPVNTLSCLL